ncbi:MULTISPECIES: multidrug effflux MFS transporter [Staphylococcus]|uniref:Bcr/CflA family efflux transporter n=3 Tax=Staphylococcus TaxID=1279 RepID=A0A364USI7_STAWA|nr:MULTISPECIES: multidrug effflux MFS transporter [Staphylococcus]AGC89790.1 major facilitator superfamily protein (MFS) [Staphylococcus warneri SG1]MCC8989463.1 multidrug effflux MFS transporter [Staphylococcus sp.]PAK72469.1 Bcr/CflA family drug resistance efflux transporter [Staphylococcus pasteuri]SKR63157.1 Bcr/CflA subfamily drug resistance transporter [Mycobacteroides abscessus subsp. abscessus]EGG96544.1 drug resistance transporter, Bcr/CflA family [Staphylococcus warneri VCU121]
MQNTSAKHFPFILIIIFGVMTTFGPLSIDMYSPSLPNVQHAFSSTTSEIQLTISFAMIGLALGQFFFGPLSDAFGRKKIALTILVIYMLASLIAVFTTDLYFFLFLRLLQGLTAGGSIVIAKASIGDKFSGDEMAKFLTSLMVVNGIITIIAPLLGGFALTISTWRSIFVILTIITIIVIIGVLMKMPSTDQSERKILNYGRIFKDFGQLLKKPSFVIPMLLQGLTYVMLFSYSAASPFITQKIYSLSPQQFSMILAVNGIGLILVSQIVALLVEKLSRYTLLIYLTLIQIIGVVLIILTLTMHWPIWMLIIAFFLNISPVTSIGPLGFALAMEERTGGSGNASSLLGLFQFILGGVISPLVGLKGQFDASPYLVIISVTAILLVILQVIYFKLNPTKYRS